MIDLDREYTIDDAAAAIAVLQLVIEGDKDTLNAFLATQDHPPEVMLYLAVVAAGNHLTRLLESLDVDVDVSAVLERERQRLYLDAS